MPLSYLDCWERAPGRVNCLADALKGRIVPGGLILYLEKYPTGESILREGESWRDLHGLRAMIEGDVPDFKLDDLSDIDVVRLIKDIKSGVYRVSVSTKGWDPSPHLDSLAEAIGNNQDITVSVKHGLKDSNWRQARYESSLVASGNPRVIIAIQGLMRALIRDLGKRGATASQAVEFVQNSRD